MVSINSTSTNRAVLASLRQTNADLATTQNRVASGLKIASAKDNSSVWATAQSIRADLAYQDTVDGSIAIAKGQADATYTAMTTIQDLLGKIKTAAAGLAAGDSAGGNTPKPNNLEIQKTIASLNEQILAVAKGSTLQGLNLVTGTTDATPTIGYDKGGAITMTFTATQIIKSDGSAGTLSTVYGYGAATITSTMTSANITTVTGAIDTAISAVNTYTASVGNYADALGSQQDFLDKVRDIRTTAVSAMVDADMEEESAKLQALQVKQQLAYQALSIGNSASQNILRLFQ